MALIGFVLEALAGATSPGYLDSHPVCVSFQEQRGTVNWNSWREVFLQMLSDNQGSP